MKGIVESGELLASKGTKNARYGDGQYFTDIAPEAVAALCKDEQHRSLVTGFRDTSSSCDCSVGRGKAGTTRSRISWRSMCRDST
jgi:hypothetical protein